MSDINPRELCDKCAANYAKCLNVGNNRYYICKECLRKQFPQETMAHKPMSKEELIQQWQMAYEHEDELGRLGINTGDAEQLALAHGALKMYDHRQKEIDVLTADLALERAMNRSHVVAQETSAPFQLGAAAANRWWASRWIAVEEASNGIAHIEAERELNAAAARVMEVKG